MKVILEKINAAKHVEIIVKAEFLFVASALYTYVLTKHKKVSFVCKDENLENRFAFLPWFEKIRTISPSTADLRVELNCSFLEAYEAFENCNSKVNQKMATALYGAMLQETRGFTNLKTDAVVFAIASELIELGADYRLCSDVILKQGSLAQLRLKSEMLKNMALANDAKAAIFLISEDDLKSSGAKMKDAQKIMLEAFSLPYVETSILLNEDVEREVVKILNKEI